MMAMVMVAGKTLSQLSNVMLGNRKQPTVNSISLDWAADLDNVHENFGSIT